jgi:hypothetical protein
MSENTFRIRFVERPLDERPLTPQAEAIRASSSLREITISSTGIEMLSTIVGRGMSPALRRAVAEALVETLQGQIPLADTADDNIFTEVYGEIIGPLVTCLERGGAFDIIRLARTKGADLLLVNRASQEVILQECKGTFIGYNKLREDGACLDVCQQIRSQRNKGRQQLYWPDADEVAGRRVHVQGNSGSPQSNFPHAEKSVVVTAVPDGRLRLRDGAVDSPPHEPCDRPCTEHCLFTPDPTLVSVLSSERVDSSLPLNPSYRTFLDWYKACERAIWGGADGSVGDAFSATLSSWAQMEVSRASREATTPFIVGLLDQAVQRGVYVNFAPVFAACEAVRQPDLVRTIRHLHDVQGERPTPRIHEVTSEELGAILYESRDEEGFARLIGNWRFRASGPRSEGEGTSVEAAMRRERDGRLSMRFVPSRAAASQAPDDLRWGISEILSSRRLPPEFVYESFSPETASWRRVRGNDENNLRGESFLIGHVLRGWPSLWVPFVDRRAIQEMHHCCPWCDRLADFLEHDGPHFWRWHHLPHHQRFASFESQADLPAFVTDDARGFVAIPSGVR